ncbi:MAG: hypothetical protein H7836_02280 [Magnetococcus sp. YQC-3]
MNVNFQVFLSGVGSLSNILPVGRYVSGRAPESYLNMIRQPDQPLSFDEAAAVNSAAIGSDWAQTGEALRNAAVSVGLHVRS